MTSTSSNWSPITALSRGASRFAARLALLPFLLAVFLALPAHAQQFTFSHYGQDEGLRNLDVFSMVEDKDGALWLATENGVFHYDGSGFQHFGAAEGLGEPLTLGLHKDAAGRIWITTNDHLYYAENSRIVSVPLGEQHSRFGAGQVLASLDRDHILFVSRGSLRILTQSTPPTWAASNFFDPAQLTAHPELARIHSILVSSSTHDLWLACGESVCRIRNPLGPRPLNVEFFSTAKGLPAEPWRALFEDNRGDLWARSFQHIRVLAHGESAFRPRDLPGTLSAYTGSGILTFAQCPLGRVFTQTNHGLAVWDGVAWRHFDSSNGVDIKDISSILIDRRGSPWFSTRGHGIYRWLGYGEIENWTSAQGMHDDLTWVIFRDRRDHLWITDQLQGGRLDNVTRRVVTPPAMLSAPATHASGVAESADGSLWAFLISGDVLRYSPTLNRVTLRGKTPPIFRTLTDSSGRIWICSRDGLYVVRTPASPQPMIEKVPDPLVASDAFADAAESPGHDLWFLADNHLYRLSHTDGRLTEIPLDPAATRGQMRNIAAAADGTLWIGGGIPALLHLRIEGTHALTLAAVTPPTLASNNVQIVRFDQRGWLWIGTDLGVNIFDGKSWRLLSRRDGIISNDTDEGSFLADRDGSVWIGVNGGAIHVLHPEHIFTDTPLDVRVTAATLGGQPLSLTANTRARWQDGSLDTAFTSGDLSRDSSLRFRYRLTGLESAWNETSAHTLHYAAVPSGDYRFELQAIDPDRRRESPTVSFSFTIRPPWWRTGLFYAVLLLLTFLASLLVWHLRERQLIQRQRMLRHLVAQRTRELEAEKAELVAAREALRQQATRDALTGLWNRPAILDILIREMDRAHRFGTSLAVVLADIDHFKQINDTLGHLAGDAILREAAQRMRHNIRPYDFLGRYGGEEFLIVMPGLPERDPHARLNQLLQSIAGEPFVFEDRTLRVTSSFGAAWLDPTIASVEDLVRRADEALYQAKARGRDRIVFYEDRCEEPQDQYSK